MNQLNEAVSTFDAETASAIMRQQGWHWVRLGRAPEAWEIRSLLLEIGQTAIDGLRTSDPRIEDYTVATGRFTATAYLDVGDQGQATIRIILEFAPLRTERAL